MNMNTKMKRKNQTSIFSLKESFDNKEEFKKYVESLNVKIIKTNKKIEYINISSCVDIESSSFIDNNGEKTAIMYCFTIGINGHSYLGRTYDELFEILDFFTNKFELTKQRRLIIYIHNLSYEFQFFYKHFIWEKVFSIKSRMPVYALASGGIEFRCSFFLSGYSLSKVGEHLQKYKVKKLVGDLDYEKIRHSKTPLMEKEKEYVLHDGLVVMAYIQEQIESHKNDISKIPLTKTGEVRKYCRNQCLYNGLSSHKKSVNHYNRYRSVMNGTKIQSVNEYKQLKRAFMGGFTHANALIVGNKINNVTSFDFTSSYPYVMVSEKYPMLKGKLITIHNKEELMKNLNSYCCLFDITFIGLKSKISFEHYISSSHCMNLENYTLDNGRIVDADKLTITITEQDYFIIQECYTWDKMLIKNFRRYYKDYLPTPFVKSILELYKNKTELKGVKGKESEYLNSKELVNSCYGMCVTDICRKDIVFNEKTNMWSEEDTEIDYEDKINKYNNSKQRFLSYNWGIWVTAYARRNLWYGILEFRNHYLYSDTDSVKVIHAEKHMKFINEYNNQVMKKLQTAMNHHQLPMDYVSPKSIDGKEHTLGLWDLDGKYNVFKTLGAKRYMVEYLDGSHSLTISGLNKKVAIPYLESKSSDIFELFKEDMYIPPRFTGKNTHTYIDVERSGEITDYLGNVGKYHELSCVHMCGADYTLSLAREYVEFLFAIKMLEYD